MTRVITRQSAENMAYVRKLLREKEPGLSAALELGLILAELELTSPAIPGQREPRSPGSPHGMNIGHDRGCDAQPRSVTSTPVRPGRLALTARQCNDRPCP
jgi:hypothetical protein